MVRNDTKIYSKLAKKYSKIMEKNIIYQGDCVEIMNTKIEENSISLIFADPPYNLSGVKLDLANNTTGGAYFKVNEEWDTYENYPTFVDFTKKWLKSSFNIIKDNGSLYISCTHHNIGEIILYAKELGFKLNNIITWYKTNSMPNITKRTFTHATEFVCWFVKGKNWIFNYDEVKKFNPHKTKKGEEKQMRDFLDFIELPILQGAERLKAENNKALHPTQKPEKLLELVILASSNENDIVLDPFFGTGTTGVVALKNQRNFIGIEMSQKYYEVANERIQPFLNLQIENA